LLRAAFEGPDDPVTLTRRLEVTLDAGRDAWPLGTIRALWDALWPLEPARSRSPEHEARWLNLAGLLLRPGFGDPGDEVRVDRLWRVLSAELRHPRAVQGRAEWWNLWKRIAGGLAARQQQHLLQLVSPALARRGARVPLAGPLNCVVPRDLAARWSERLLAAPWPRAEAYAFALAQLARATGDRERDLDPELRERGALAVRGGLQAKRDALE